MPCQSPLRVLSRQRVFQLLTLLTLVIQSKIGKHSIPWFRIPSQVTVRDNIPIALRSQWRYSQRTSTFEVTITEHLGLFAKLNDYWHWICWLIGRFCCQLSPSRFLMPRGLDALRGVKRSKPRHIPYRQHQAVSIPRRRIRNATLTRSMWCHSCGMASELTGDSSLGMTECNSREQWRDRVYI